MWMRPPANSRVCKVLPVGVVAGDPWLLYQDVASTMVRPYSRTMVEQDVWQNVPGCSAVPALWLLCILPFVPSYPHLTPTNSQMTFFKN
jgi:hypothetical protein